MLPDVIPQDIPDVKLVIARRLCDHRGFFSETYHAPRFRAAGIEADFMQDNHSLSTKAGTVRGLHYQAPPFAQAKLVRVIRGAVIDVAVDVRRGSPTYGRWVKTHLSAANGAQVFIPRGFLHGFATLEPDTEVIYKVDNSYSAQAAGTILWNDPDLAIDWGVNASAAVLSERDANAARFCDFISPF